jgi:type I restriction enzyme, R subunit
MLKELFKELLGHQIFEDNFPAFLKYQRGSADVQTILDIENNITIYINKNKEEAKTLKFRVNTYFKILNLIQFVIETDEKYAEANFLEFWQKFNNIYNTLLGTMDLIDEVDVYFDNRIGIVSPKEIEESPKGGNGGANEPSTTYGKQYKFDILAVIEKRNEEEEEIEELIIDFEKKIEQFFDVCKFTSEW